MSTCGNSGSGLCGMWVFITCQVKSHKTDSIKRIEKNLIESFEKIKTFFSSDKYLLIKLDQGGLKIHETLIIIIRVVADEDLPFIHRIQIAPHGEIRQQPCYFVYSNRMPLNPIRNKKNSRGKVIGRKQNVIWKEEIKLKLWLKKFPKSVW